MNEIPKNVSEAVRRRNPHLYGSVRQVEAQESKPAPIPALASRPPRCSRRKRGMVRVIVGLTMLSHRELDDDNLQGALKPLRDAIAIYFSVDDRDERIRWEYGQAETKGEEGVIVRLQTL